MKTFEEFKKNVNLKRYIGSTLGTMYFEPDLPRDKDYIIRHLDAELTEELLPVYLQLYEAVKQWIETNSTMKEYLFMPELIEVGKDYIIRPFYVYIKSVRSYFDEDDSIEPSQRYFEMIRDFSIEMLNVYVEDEDVYPTKTTVIKRVLRNSLFGASGKTILDDRNNGYIIVEPKIYVSDLEQWQRL